MFEDGLFNKGRRTGVHLKSQTRRFIATGAKETREQGTFLKFYLGGKNQPLMQMYADWLSESDLDEKRLWES